MRYVEGVWRALQAGAVDIFTENYLTDAILHGGATIDPRKFQREHNPEIDRIYRFYPYHENVPGIAEFFGRIE